MHKCNSKYSNTLVISPATLLYITGWTPVGRLTGAVIALLVDSDSSISCTVTTDSNNSTISTTGWWNKINLMIIQVWTSFWAVIRLYLVTITKHIS